MTKQNPMNENTDHTSPVVRGEAKSTRNELFYPSIAIAFGVWLTGHDEATVKQMYDDFYNSGKDMFKPYKSKP